jgi:hypothetical protein
MIGKKREDPNERPEFGRHWGDWAGVVLALIFLIAFLGILFGPNPLVGLDKTDEVLNRIAKERDEKAATYLRQQQNPGDDAAGVVTVGIPPKKKPN